jgi:proline iminopeptidase
MGLLMRGKKGRDLAGAHLISSSDRFRRVFRDMPQDQRAPDAPLLPLFAPIEPYSSGMLDLEAPHRMYYEQSGNPRGVPVVFLHGGPGAGSSAVHRQFFDPTFYRIVVLDQRGAGRSTPLGCIENNTTPKLIDDLERLRAHLGIEKWLVFGGSWGSTLALAYAEHHPGRCLGLILRGIFLCRPSEIEWFLYGLKAIFPEAWRTFSGYIPEAERGDLLAAYHQRLTDPDPAVHMPAARAWSVYEGSCSTLLPNPALVADFASDRVALGLARIEAHYFRHGIFLPPDFLIQNANRLARIPGVIVQGRYDIVCPTISADDLHRAWPAAEYVVVHDAGHSAFEPGIRSRLVLATEEFKKRV